MQFQVPQFLDVEDKIIGPFTLKQFLYLVGGVGLAYTAQRFISFLGIGYLIAIACVALGGTLAYYRPNRKPFADMLESAFNFYRNTRLYIWQRQEKKTQETHLDLNNFQTTKHVASLVALPTNTNKLGDLTWSIDVQSSAVEEPKTHTDSLVI